jgi:SAM-dependent methyltransferase
VTTGVGPQPDDAYFELMASVAETHWWYRARRALVAELLAGRVRGVDVALDVGCGTGETLDTLESLGARAAAGTDLSPAALGFARRTARRRVVRSVAEHLPFATASAGALISTDVIEHLDNDVAALAEYVRVLRPGSPILLTVPAYDFLWSDHDVKAAHRRRYSAGRLEAAARAAGIEVDRVSYFFTFLVPPAVLLRRTPLRRLVRATDEEASSVHPLVDRAFAVLAALERRLLRRFRLPFGLSIVLVGTTPRARAGESTG